MCSPAPVSIIKDGATDETQNHFIAVLLQIIENNQPKVIFYRLLENTDGEGAEDLKKLLVKAFQTNAKFIMVSSLIENVKKYFPEGRLEMYKVLDPKTWPSPYQTDFGLRDIHDLYDLLKPPRATKQEVVTQWPRMVKAILADDKLIKYKRTY